MDMIGTDKSGSLRSGLIAAAILLGSLTCAKVASCLIEPKRVAGVVAYATARSDPDPNRVQPYLDETKDTANALKEKNLFVKAPPKQHPVKQVEGILGREVLIGDKWYKVGDKIGEATVVSVQSTQVTIAWDGRNKTFAPLAAVDAGGPPADKRPPPKSKEAQGESSKPAATAEVAEAVVVEGPSQDDPLAWLGMDLPPEVRAKFLEMWNSMPDEQKDKAKRDWNRMSDEEKEQAVESMQQRL